MPVWPYWENPLGNELFNTFAATASSSIAAGIDIHAISSALGHYSTAYTMDTYGHLSQEMQSCQKSSNHFSGSLCLNNPLWRYLRDLKIKKGLPKPKKDGEGGIRTLETLLTPTRFPIVRPQPN